MSFRFGARNAVSLGPFAASTLQQPGAIAIGAHAGRHNQGAHSIAIGANAGHSNQHQSTIVMNATGIAINTLQTESTYMAPIRPTNSPFLMTYNSTTKEVTYGDNMSGSLGIGTTSPGEFRLYVNGTSYMNGTVAMNGNLTLSGTGTTAGVLAKRYYLSERGDNQDDVAGDEVYGPWYGLGDSGITGFIGKPCLTGFYGCALRSGLGYMVVAENGNVGIGTTDPKTQLSIARDIAYADRASNPFKAQTTIKSSTNGQRLYLGTYYTGGEGSCSVIQSSDFYSELDHGAHLLINPLGGIVGIGTDPTSLLHLYNATEPLITLQLNTVDYSYISAYADLFLGANVKSGGTGIKNGNRGTASIRLVPEAYDGGYMTFSTSDAEGDAPTERMRIDKNGNVGIGTVPTGRLDIYSATTDYRNNVVILQPWAGVTFDNTQLTGGRKWHVFSGGEGAGIGKGNFGIYDGTADAYRLCINSSGRVGIKTESPEGDLHVKLAGAASDYWGKLVVKTTSFWGDGCSSRSETAGTQYATMYPMMFLAPHIVSDTDGWCRVRMGRSGGIATGRWWEMAVRADGNFQIGVEGNNQFEIDRRGYVGIGGVNTSYQLNVNGQARVTGLTTIGDIRLNPNAFGNGNQVIGTDSGHLILYPLTGKTAINLPSNVSLTNALEVGGNIKARSGSLYADNDIIGQQVYTNDWFRINSNNSGLYWQNLGYGIVSPQQQDNAYGNITTYGAGASSWQGYGIRGRFCFMAYSYADDWGIHDNSYSWLIRGNGGSTRRVYMSGGVAMFAREWDRFVVWRTATEDDYGNGYFYVNENWGYGYTSDQRIKQDIEIIPEDKSVAFIKNLQPSRFRAKDSQPVKCKIGDEETEITPQCCNCQTIDGFIAQNVLESATKAQVSKSMVNHWYEYEEELKKPVEEQQMTKENILGVNDTPILSHCVNVIKSLLKENEDIKQLNEQQNQKINELQSALVRHNELLAQIFAKLNSLP